MQKKSWRAALQTILNENNRDALRRNKVISHETMQDRAEILFLSFKQLREMGFKIEEPRNLAPRHVEALMEKWEMADQLSASTLQKRLSVLRAFAKWINKEGMIASTESYMKNPQNAKRSYIAKEDKSWSAKDIDIHGLIAQIQQYDPYVGIQLKLMWAFGLRRKEAICFKPRRNDKGEFIEVGQGAVVYLKEGTKGGRARIAEFDYMPDAAQRRAVLDEAKAFVGSEDAHVGRPGKNLLQNINRFEYVMRKFGLTHSELGVTGHGLRHQAMSDGYEALTGVPSPVRGGVLQDPALKEQARLRMTRNAGHNRTQITSAYYGK